MKTLVFLDYFTPAYRAGGPIRIFEALAQGVPEGSEVFIVTQNTDWGHPGPLPGVPENQWHPFERAKVFYASAAQRNSLWLRSLSELGCESVHLNSLFSRTWTMKLLFLRRRGFFPGTRFFLSPHGELAASALAIKPARKKVFLAVAKALGLFKGLTWIATSDKEVEEIKSRIGQKAEVLLIPPPFPKVFKRALSAKAAGELHLVFFARLSAMKNIGHLVPLLSRLKGRVRFDIYGPVDTEYESTWRETLRRFTSDSSCEVRYLGPMPSSKAMATLAGYHLFVQPSLSENFGYSILEALAAGTPALISNRTPWNEIGPARAGFALALETTEAWVQALQTFVDMSEMEWAGWSKRAQDWVARNDRSARELFNAYGASNLADDSEGDQTPRSRASAKSANGR